MYGGAYIDVWLSPEQGYINNRLYVQWIMDRDSWPTCILVRV